MDIINSNDNGLFEEYIIENGVDKDINGYGRSILYFIIKNGNIDFLKILIKHNVNLKYNLCGTALHQSVNENKKNDRYAIIELLLKYIDIDSQDEFRFTPLHYAISNNDIELVKYLLSKGADVNRAENRGFNSLHLAISNHNYDIIKLLCDKGCDKKMKNYRDNTPLDLLNSCLSIKYMNSEEIVNYNKIKSLLSDDK